MSDQQAMSLPDDIKTLRFLVAEKNPSLQKNIVGYLKEAGAAQIDAVADGKQAWDLWKESRAIQFFVCATSLKEMGGLELLGKLRGDSEAPSQPMFLLISADKSDAAEAEAKSKGADGFLGKPFSQDQFIPKLIESAAARRQSGGGRSRGSIEDELLLSRLPVELMFDRYSTEVECEELSEAKAVIRVTNNYGLGTQLNMRFSRTVDGQGGYFKPIKGIVMKTERVPNDIGVFRLHVQFNGPVTAAHGVPELLKHVPAPAASP